MRKLTYFSTLVLIFALPWEDGIAIPGIGSLARMMGFAAGGLWFATIVIEGRFRKPALFHVLVLLFFLWNIVTLFWSFDLEYSIQRIKTYSQIFLLLLIYWDVYRNREELTAGLQAYVLGAYVLIGSTVYNYLTNNVAVQYEGRFSATGINANDVALVLILGLPMSLALAMQLFCEVRKSRMGALLRGIDILYMPLCIFAIFLTGSRTSLIAVMPFVVFIIGAQRIRWDRKALLFALLLVSILVLISFVPQTLINRIGTIGSSIRQADLGGRVTMWRKSVELLAQHSIFGVGTGAVDRTIGGAVHNTLLSVATETGFIGLVQFLSILGLVLYEVIGLPKKTSGLWLTIFGTWAIGAISLSWEFRKITWVILNFVIIAGSLETPSVEQTENAAFSQDANSSVEPGERVPQPTVIGQA